MFFSISNGKIQEIAPNSTDTECIRVGYLSLEELKKKREKLGISKRIITEFEQERSHYWNGVDVYDDFSIGVVNIVNVMNVKEARDRIGFVIQRNQFILVKLVDLDDSYKDIFVHSIGRFRQNATLEKVIYGMNFTNMPELTWKYGYVAVIILSIMVVTMCFILFKKKKLL